MVVLAAREGADTSVINVAAIDAVANEADKVHMGKLYPAELTVGMLCNDSIRGIVPRDSEPAWARRIRIHVGVEVSVINLMGDVSNNPDASPLHDPLTFTGGEV